MKKRLESAVLAILLCLSLLPTAALAETDTITPTVPEKDENGVYQISNANELYGFAEIVNNLNNKESWDPHANAVLTADITVNEGVLKPDGTLNTEKKNTFKQWAPIGYNVSSNDVWYGGTFDGQNHTISGLYCDTDQFCAGLFGHAASNSFVKNVTVADSYFSASSRVGGVCGWNEYCTVIGCINESTVIGTQRYSSVGGLCGYSDYGYIEKCSNFGTVIGTGEYSDVGGVCGRNEHRSIAGCYNAGTVTGNGWGVGGVCGSFSQGAIISCHNVGVVTGSGKYVGGVYGYKERNIGKGCYYLDNDAVEGDEQAKTAADFKNGTVCDLLNEALEQSRYEFKFYQGKDYPVLTPQIAFIGIEDGKTYCGEVNFTVRCAESVTEDGEKLVPDEYNQYILLPGEHTITATDADGKSETIKVTVNADHTPADAVRENEVAATCTTAGSYDEVVYCSVCHEKISSTSKVIEKLAHDFSVLQHDETQHWFKCSRCDATNSKIAHTGGTATCTAKAHCEVCDAEYGELAAHDFSVLQHDETQHWFKCSRCDATNSKIAHTGGTATCTAKAHCEVCDAEYGELAAHDFSVLQHDETQHWFKCSRCDATNSKIAHTGGTATCTAKAHCEVCDAEYGELAAHDFGNNLEYCKNGCGTKNPNYVPPYNPPHKPSVKPNPTPSKPETPENPFVDVKKDDYYYDAVIWAVGKGIAKGVTDTTFQPNASCTRAEMVTFLYRAAGSPEPTNKVNPFTDVAEDSYYYKAVLWAVEKGIAKGTSETTFSPNDTCTRGQAVAFLYRYANSPAVSGSNSFADVSETAYYYDGTLWAVSKKVTEGTSATTFSPNDLCTRGQIVTFLYRYMGK